MTRPAALRLSKKQVEILAALRRYAEENGYMPSVRELADEVGRSSTTVYQHLKCLEKKGYLRCDGSAHGWEILETDEVERGLQSAAKTLTVGEDPLRPVASSVPVPIRGEIAAGAPLEAIDDPTETLHLPRDLARDGCYALRVRGRSMEEDHILDGDIIIVEPRDTVDDGTIAVAILDDGTATLKRVYREKGRIRLQPANATMKPFYVDSVRVQGRVRGVIRTCA